MPPGRPAIKVVHVSCVVTLLTHPRTRGHTLDSGHSGCSRVYRSIDLQPLNSDFLKNKETKYDDK